MIIFIYLLDYLLRSARAARTARAPPHLRRCQSSNTTPVWCWCYCCCCYGYSLLHE